MKLTTYWYWAKHLDWSYYDHPPMAACIMAFFAGLGGNREFFVRIGGLLSSVLVIGLIYLSCRRLSPENRDVPWEVIFVANITLLFAAGCIIQPPPILPYFYSGRWRSIAAFGSSPADRLPGGICGALPWGWGF